MKKIIILDFNRTIYNPETGKLYTGIRSVLGRLSKNYTLFLVTSGSKQKKERGELIKKLKIKDFFKKILICEKKNKKVFSKIIKNNIDKNSSYVIGDRARKEIMIGNILNLKTIWIRSGKFQNESPRNKKEKPDFIVKNIQEILNIVL